jgi:cytochrome c oxidase subunit II
LDSELLNTSRQTPQSPPSDPSFCAAGISARRPSRHRFAGVASRRGARLAALLASPLIAYGFLLALAPDAFAFFTPRSGGSPNANSIDDLYKIVLYIAIVVFVLVEGALAYALWRFRAKKHKVAEQTHGNTRLEIGWTLGAVIIVIALATVTLLKLGGIENPPNSDPNGAKLVGQSGVLYASAEKRLPPSKKALEIEVIGRQFVWQYVYPGGEKTGLGAPYSYEEMVVPTHTTVIINVVSMDVIHGWWVPQLGGKLQAVPGYHNYGWFKIDKPGVFHGQCANLCGRGGGRTTETGCAAARAHDCDGARRAPRAVRRMDRKTHRRNLRSKRRSRAREAEARSRRRHGKSPQPLDPSAPAALQAGTATPKPTATHQETSPEDHGHLRSPHTPGNSAPRRT